MELIVIKKNNHSEWLFVAHVGHSSVCQQEAYRKGKSFHIRGFNSKTN